MLRWGFATLVLVTGVAAGVACSSTTTTSAPANAGNADAAVTYASSPCGTCVATACAAAIATCNADPTCATYLTCVDACTVTSAGDVNPTCEAACPAPSGSAGTSAQSGLDTCRKQGAGAACSECGAADGGQDGATTCALGPALMQTCAASTDTNVCNKCQFEKCCDSAKKVYGSGPTKDFTDCYNACSGDIACVTACEKKYPTGVAGYTEFAACLDVKCLATGLCHSNSACGTCNYQMCACELALCNADPDCWHLSECVADCASLTCAEACAKAAPPASAALYKTYGACTSQRCISACAGDGG